MTGEPGVMVGRRIAGYRLEKEIGRGGMAVVYRALDLELGRVVAVKLLAPELAGNEVFRQRFVSESKAAAAIDHPHIVPIYEAGQSDGVLYIAMRYVVGSDLRVLLDLHGRLPLAQAVRIAGQVASALDAAHAHGLVHRDVKPGNILVAEGTDAEHPEHVYLTDFGLTKKSLSLTGFTTLGQFVGTVQYVAPEQITGKPVDGRCDVYGLGCVVFEALAGAPPFVRDDDMALLWAHLNDPPPRLTSARPDLPAGVDAVFARALAKAPEDRYDSCLGFVAGLRDAAAGGHAPTRVAGRPEGLEQVASRPVASGLGPAPVSVPVGVPVPVEEQLPEPPAWGRPVYSVRRVA